MKLIVENDILTITEKEDVNSGSLNYKKIPIEFNEAWDSLVKKVVLVFDKQEFGQEIAVIDDEVFIDSNYFGKASIGIVGYTIEEEQKVYQISTNLKRLTYNQGAGSVDVGEHEVPSASEWELYLEQIAKILDEAATKLKEEIMAQIRDEIPTKTSQLVNDSDFVSDADYVHTDNNFTTEEKEKLESLENYDDSELRGEINTINGQIDGLVENINEIVEDVAAIDTKITGIAEDVEKNKADILDLEDNINHLDDTKADKEEIPTKTSELTNDSDFVSDPTYVHTDNNFTTDEKNKLSNLDTDVANIKELIPDQATADNQLADKEFVNSSIASNTANFIGTFNSLQELQAYSGTLTNNDYAFVIGTDSSGNTEYKRYKYNGQEWLYEYTLNNSSFTSEQWESINSGITSGLVEQITTNKNAIQALEDEVAQKTEKVELVYANGKITRAGQEMNYKQLHDLLKTTPDFVYLLSGGWVYLPTFVQEGSGLQYIRFGSTIISEGKAKSSNVYIQSSDGQTITNISSTVINSENVTNKISEINDSNKTSTALYPNAKAVNDFVNGRGFLTSADLENMKDTYVKEGVTENSIELTNEEKMAAKEWLGVEDYSEDIGELKRVDEGLYKDLEDANASGDNIVLNNSAEAKINIGISGKELEQKQYEGKNLLGLDYNNITTSHCSYTRNGNTFTIINTDNYNPSIKIKLLKDLAIGTYTLNSDIRLSDATIIRNNSNVNICNFSSAYAKSVRTSSDIGAYIEFNWGTRTDEIILDLSSIMILEGDYSNKDIGEFEPYVGGTSSPNPDYPQPVKSVDGAYTITESNLDNTEQQEFSLDLSEYPLYSANDNIYYSEGKFYVHNEWGEYVFTGEENVIFDGQNSTRTVFAINKFLPIIPYTINTEVPKLIANKLKTVSQLVTWKPNEISMATVSQALYFIVEPNKDLDYMKNVLRGMTLDYQLAEPTETEITDPTLISQLTALRNAFSYFNKTNIIVTTDGESLKPTLNVEYKLSNLLKINELEANKADRTELSDFVQNEKFDTLAEKVAEMELFKFPNVIIHGTPTINNGQVSDFSTANYLSFPAIFDLHDRGFEFNFAVRTGSDITTAQNILGSNFCMALLIEGAKLKLRVSSNGTSWDLVDITGSIDVAANTNYYIQIYFDKLTYKLRYSLDGISYTDIASKVASVSPFARQIYLGIGNNFHNPFKGMINLNKCNLKVNNSVIWQGMDDAGLATRMAVDMDNIDEAGKEKLAEVASEKGFVKDTDHPTKTKGGAVKVNSSNGIGLMSDGTLKVASSSDAQNKKGTDSFKPIVPSNQHSSVFWGLSKIAGVDLKDRTDAVLGTYPQDAKLAILSMLGVDAGLATRMAVDMENIDEAGKDKLAEIASDKGFVKNTDTVITNKELLANKSQTIDDSTTKYPSNKAVKDYIDSLDGNEVAY